MSSAITDIQKMIERVVVTHHGIRAGLIDEALMESVIAEIVKQFKTLTVQDIEYAYERANIPRDDNWRNVTKKIILDPIDIWHNKKAVISEDYRKYKEVSNEKAEGIAKAKKFKSECIVVYAQSLKDEKWLGNIWQAAIVAPLLGDHIDQIDKTEIWWRAENDFSCEEEAAKYNIGMIKSSKSGRTEYRIFCERIVNYGILLNIPL